jgi:hypothetical protein
MLFFRAFSIFTLIGLLTITLSSNARAGCYEDVGCTDRDNFSERALARLSCQNLAFLRNSIYAENGYCFKDADYQHIFGNDYCRFDISSAVPLTRTERENVLSIVRMEKTKSCR